MYHRTSKSTNQLPTVSLKDIFFLVKLFDTEIRFFKSEEEVSFH